MDATKVKAVIEAVEKQYDFNDYVWNYLKEDEVTECEDIEDVLQLIRDANDNGDITNAEVIYYSTAMEYLKENDPSLTTSLGLAADIGYTADKLNSELLASILKTDDNQDDFASFIDEVEEKLEEALSPVMA